MPPIDVGDRFVQDLERRKARALDRVEVTPEPGEFDLLPTEAEADIEREDPPELTEQIDAEDRAVQAAADQHSDLRDRVMSDIVCDLSAGVSSNATCVRRERTTPQADRSILSRSFPEG